MAKKHIRYHNEAQAELGKILRFAGRKHGLWQVFRDFVAMSAIAISNAVDKSAYAEREADYLAMVARYSREELDELSRGLACIVMGLEAGPDDFLGALYMSLELGDAWNGQFFTPYQVSYLMAAMTVGDGTQQEIDRKGYVSVSDPAIGGGAMVIAAAHVLQDKQINYQQAMHATGVDVDIVAVHMAYIQLSLLHIPAVIQHGNSLSMEVWSSWKTPAHILGLWDVKLKRQAQENQDAPSPTRVPDPVRVVHSKIKASHTKSEELATQLDLFAL